MLGDTIADLVEPAQDRGFGALAVLGNHYVDEAHD